MKSKFHCTSIGGLYLKIEELAKTKKFRDLIKRQLVISLQET
jgi:hypothetical protein